MNDYHSDNTNNSGHSDSKDDLKENLEATEQSVETHKNSRLALSIALLALFFTALGITVGYKHWLRMHNKAKVALNEISVIKQQLDNTALKTNLDELRSSFLETSNNAEQRLTKSLQELDQIREQTAYSAKTVTDQISELTLQQQIVKPGDTANDQSLLNEIRFLLEAAKRRLSIEYNKMSALSLLKEADQLLIQLASPKWATVREKLATDIATLEGFSLPNTELLSATISKLETEIKPLAVVEKELPDGEAVTLFDVKDTDEASLPNKLKSYLNESVSIKKQTESARQVLNSSDKERIDLLIRLRLESLRLMLMQRHNETYHQQINNLKHMLNTYYPPATAKPWLETLTKLDGENLTPTQPNISTALDHFLLSVSSQKEDNESNKSNDKTTDLK